MIAIVLALSLARAPAQPKVPKEAARKTALARVKGAQVKSEELETEHGKLVWSFDLTVPGKEGVEEVQVDAKTGDVVSVAHESAKAESDEKD